jgi:hypothetical protein
VINRSAPAELEKAELFDSFRHDSRKLIPVPTSGIPLLTDASNGVLFIL